MDKETKKKWDRACYTGIILMIVGHVSFSNYERVGDALIMIGTCTIMVSKFVKWRGRRANLRMDQSNTYSS